jgi:CRP-like cAMP-binding protein
VSILDDAVTATAAHVSAQIVATRRLTQRNGIIIQAVTHGGHSQTAVAEACGLSRESVSKILRHRRSLTSHADTNGNTATNS